METGVTETGVATGRGRRDKDRAYRARARSLAELRTMTDTERGLWLQSCLPQHYVTCPGCAGDGCPSCVETGRMSKAGARAYIREQLDGEAF